MKLGGREVTDDYEKIIEDALIYVGLDYRTESPETNNLDFYIPQFNVYIEVKTMHTERVYKQMDRVHECIMVQGKQACELLASMISLAYGGNNSEINPKFWLLR